MGLLTKFVLLVCVLSAAVIVNLLTTWWAIGVLERELSWPLVSMQTTLDALHEVRDELIALDLADYDRSLSPEKARQSLDRIGENLNRLNAEASTRLRVGISTQANLQDRFAHMRTITDRWEAGSAGGPAAFRESRLEAIVLIGRVEQRVIDDAALAVGFGDDLRRRVFTMILTSVLLTLATIGLSAIFMRRWVIGPVDALRHGTIRFASGDLNHRVRVTSRDQLGRLAGDFNTMAGTIVRLQDERIERERLAAIGEMLRRVVHNLRTPLAGIRGLAESTRHETEPGGEIDGMQTRIIASVDRFEAWLRDLLRSSAPLQIKAVPTRLEGWLEGVVAGRADAARAAGIALDVRIDPSAPESTEIDPGQLAHAVAALLDNAIDATADAREEVAKDVTTHTESRIMVLLEGGSEPGSWALSISDQGPGIPAEDLGRVFEPSFTTKPRGTGIGLAMTRSIVEAHSGRIEVETRRDEAGEGCGTMFRLVLPARATGRGGIKVASGGQ